LLRTWRIGWPITGLAWSPVDPHLVAVAGANGTITLWDVSIPT
jgi:WD40 repeat protein